MSRALASRFCQYSRGESDLAIELCRKAHTVRSHEESAACRSNKFEREFQDLIARGFVEVARGLVRQQKTRARRDAPVRSRHVAVARPKVARDSGRLGP